MIEAFIPHLTLQVRRTKELGVRSCPFHSLEPVFYPGQIHSSNVLYLFQRPISSYFLHHLLNHLILHPTFFPIQQCPRQTPIHRTHLQPLTPNSSPNSLSAPSPAQHHCTTTLPLHTDSHLATQLHNLHAELGTSIMLFTYYLCEREGWEKFTIRFFIATSLA
jgi:hypothetical protein